MKCFIEIFEYSNSACPSAKTKIKKLKGNQKLKIQKRDKNAPQSTCKIVTVALWAATHLDIFSSQNWNTLGNPVTDAAGRSRKKLCLGTHKKIFLAASSLRLDRPCRGRRGLWWHCFLYLKGTIIGEMLKHNFCRYHEAESIRCSLHYVLKSWKSVNIRK